MSQSLSYLYLISLPTYLSFICPSSLSTNLPIYIHYKSKGLENVNQMMMVFILSG